MSVNTKSPSESGVGCDTWQVRCSKSEQESGPIAKAVTKVAVRLQLIGKSKYHHQLLHDLYRAAQFDAEIFLEGETGVGKELYARFVHESSPRSGGEFVAVNCGAIPDSLFENEMFGHSAGAYTDAKTREEGLVAAAHGGTLFLDEVDGLSKAGQVKLLRLLQEKEYRRLGEARLRRADIRVISAMNCDPQQAIADGKLRRDLFYRLYVYPRKIVPVRDRPEDAEELIYHFVQKYCRETGRKILEFSPAARNLLCAYHWPGNIRQLENVIRSLLCQLPAERTRVEAEDMSFSQPPDAVPAYVSEHLSSLLGTPFAEAKRQIVECFEVDYIVEMLRRTHGNISQAARLAGKHRRAFFELMRKHGIAAEEFKN